MKNQGDIMKVDVWSMMYDVREVEADREAKIGRLARKCAVETLPPT